jgi:hypothetical protein
MKSYAKAKNHRAHGRTQSPAPTQQPPEVERRINTGWLKLWRTVYPNTPPPTAPTRKAQGSGFKVRPPSAVLVRRTGGSTVQLPAAVERLASFLSVSLTLALLATGCAGPRPLKGGKAVTTHKPGGVIEQTLVQSENPAAATKQDQDTVKVRTFTLPAGSRIEQSQAPVAVAALPSTLNSQPPVHHSFSGGGSTTFLLSAPMPVVEREETHAASELGAAQKDTARELGAKLSSLKGIVWVGIGLFVFGLASLVYPPLKVIIGSVTTSAALMLGGLALMVLPSLIVGNELLILGGVGVAVGGWFLAHRHGQLRGIVAASIQSPAHRPTTAAPDQPSQPAT